jgi:hypothetical protein
MVLSVSVVVLGDGLGIVIALWSFGWSSFW